MKFTEETLEQAVIELFEAEQIPTAMVCLFIKK
jgi:hypothetical protein